MIHQRLTVIGERKVKLDGQTVSYTIKSSTRSKNVRFEVKPGTGLVVVVPESYRIGQLPDLIKAKKAWVLRNLAIYGDAEPLASEKELKSGDIIPYLDRDLELVIQQNHKNVNSVRLGRGRLVVSLGSENSRLNIVLEQWYRAQAAKLIRNRADELSARLGLTYNRLTIRGQRSRWGSCSHKGNLSFNWKLMMAPKPVIDYVIIHEIAHLKELNHSKRFWELVAEHCPLWRQHRKWLKAHEKELMTKFLP